MKIIWPIINFIQIVIICAWSLVCSTLGMLLMLITWNGAWVHKINGLYLWSPLVRLVAGVRVKIIGREKVSKKKSFIYIANHASHFDILAIASTMPVGLFFIVKKELFRIPLFGQYMRLIGHISVDRKNKELALQSMNTAAEKIKAGKNVIVFAEGTRTKTGQLLQFKRGAFMIAKAGNVDIIPVGISGSRKVLASGKFNIRPGAITVNVGDVISHTHYADMSVEQLAEHTRTKVRELIQEN